mmetsp:Transcript_1576/g.3384  ORF Transcript_1576/g.3384 Transcript_1576/m.3384 type:complete len:261 (+) Transcript_1576:132-914(+)|eukprot:CAMPEP_0172307770 /NCGR_PEP_ID=MMETSP1058-20130122/8548_1 /TAXON_ID=83371 /ORGANISM="Detonula confervacea, Strain CCMP 353" /LENGTH=260 /DNA_ID=CAMNT_0013020027 /DNA_START=101 /DNA_END=883 /DNA_ORIENTATION=-
MADPQTKPQVAVDVDPAPLPQTQTFSEPRAMLHDQHPPDGQQQQQHQQRSNKPAGPQLWAVVFALGGIYYLWTRVLGKSLPGFAQRGGGGYRIGAKKGHSIGSSSSSSSSGNRQAEIQAARERQQQRLQTASRAHEMVKQAKNGGNVRERTNAAVSSGNNKSTLTIQQQQQLLKQQQEQKQKQQDLEDKKKKQRQLYLKQKAETEKEEEMRRKDEESGPGWRYREDPNGATSNSVNAMDPQSGSGGGGYKPQACSRKKGG